MSTRRKAPSPLHVNIVSGRTSPASCLVTWGEVEHEWPVATVRTLAEAMVNAAARAETEAAVVATMRQLGMGDLTLHALMTDLRSRYADHGFGIKGTLTLVPSVSVVDGEPFAHANIDPYFPTRMSPQDLRGTAADWVRVAETAEHDAMFTYAMAEADVPPDQIEAVFAAARNVRPGGLRDTDRHTEDTDG